MGLFTKKKLPEFPKMPEKPSFPEYEPQVAVPEPFKMNLPPMEESEEEFQVPVRRLEMPRPRPVPAEEIAPVLRSPSGPQPLFVKIDRYKAAIKALTEIKNQLSEAEATLTKLNAIKVKEQDEIARWEAELLEIKEKLMAIDKNLFEV